MPAPILQKPLDRYYIWETGDWVLRAFLDLEVTNPQGIWYSARFRVDSGSDMATVPAFWAKSLGLPLGLGPVQVTRSTADGSRQTVTVRSGLLSVRVPGLDQTVYRFPCYFIGDPDVPRPPTAPAANLLGITGVVNQLRLTLDGTPTAGAAFGNLIVEKL